MKNHRAGGKTPACSEVAATSLAGPEDTGGALRDAFSRALGSEG
jgi:hypothetical protein